MPQFIDKFSEELISILYHMTTAGQVLTTLLASRRKLAGGDIGETWKVAGDEIGDMRKVAEYDMADKMIVAGDEIENRMKV